MTERCPACGERIEEIESVGPVTHELQPCGHQVDEEVYQDLVDD